MRLQSRWWNTQLLARLVPVINYILPGLSCTRLLLSHFLASTLSVNVSQRLTPFQDRIMSTASIRPENESIKQ